MSEKKVLKVLEENPTGLSITDIAEKANLHRNTVATVVRRLQDKKAVELKKVGLAKVYYLKHYQALHHIESAYKGQNLSVGLGVSDLADGYKAAVSAAKQAVNQSGRGEQPTFAIVFVSSRYNDQLSAVVTGLNQILGENTYIGCTTDREINSLSGFCQGTVSVLTLNTKYLHFGVGVAEYYIKQPFEAGKKATKEAIDNCPVDRSNYATAQFMRGTKKAFAEIVKNPPYFALTFVGGVRFENKEVVPSFEHEFLEGIKEILGPFIPIVGGSAGSDFDKVDDFEGENYVLAKGKFYKGGAAVCFVVSELFFSYGLEQGYISTEKYGVITKVSDNGRMIDEINNLPALEEYCKLTGLKKETFLKNPSQYLSLSSMCTLDSAGNLYPIGMTMASADPKETRFYSQQKFIKGTLFAIGKYDEKKTINSTMLAIQEACIDNEDKMPVLAININCATRRFLLGDKVNDELAMLQKDPKHKDMVFFGFHSFGEIGAKRNQPSSYLATTSTCLVIFDKLMVE
ncbi:MAG: FIST C-terminal domain-containing protein [Candidatus Aenigmarchaeota archaeon]|nr:FIST C-terminal domain-containing protein [Candidatus Aenigmarchaeota archaeon]